MAQLENGGSRIEGVRWPGVVGVTGLIVAILLFVDKIDDLVVTLAISPEGWTKLVGQEYGEVVARMMPPTTWLVLSALIGTALSALLFVGSLRIRKRLRSGIDLCRRWSQLAIVWGVVEIALAAWWLQAHGDVMGEIAKGGWQGATILGLLVALAVILAFPVFLLVWFARPGVREEYAGWSEE